MISLSIEVILWIASRGFLIIVLELGLDFLNLFGVSFFDILDSILEGLELIVEVLDSLIAGLDDRRFGEFADRSVGGYFSLTCGHLIVGVQAKTTEFEGPGHGEVGVGGFGGLGQVAVGAIGDFTAEPLHFFCDLILC